MSRRPRLSRGHCGRFQTRACRKAPANGCVRAPPAGSPSLSSLTSKEEQLITDLATKMNTQMEAQLEAQKAKMKAQVDDNDKKVKLMSIVIAALMVMLVIMLFK